MRIRAALRRFRLILSSPPLWGSTSQPQLRDYPIARPPHSLGR
jgi:hypothetical protein